MTKKDSVLWLGRAYINNCDQADFMFGYDLRNSEDLSAALSSLLRFEDTLDEILEPLVHGMAATGVPEWSEVGSTAEFLRSYSDYYLPACALLVEGDDCPRYVFSVEAEPKAADGSYIRSKKRAREEVAAAKIYATDALADPKASTEEKSMALEVLEWTNSPNPERAFIGVLVSDALAAISWYQEDLADLIRTLAEGAVSLGLVESPESVYAFIPAERSDLLQELRER